MARNQMPSIELNGFAEFGELLRTIPGNLLTEVAQGMRAVGGKITRAARSKLRKNHGLDTGTLKKSLGIRSVKKFPKESKVVMYVGTRRGHATVVSKENKKTGRRSEPRKHDPFYIAHLVEFGHRIAVEKKGSLSKLNFKLKPKIEKGEKQAENVGIVKGRPFLRPAVDELRGDYEKTMVEKLTKVLARRAAKAAK